MCATDVVAQPSHRRTERGQGVHRASGRRHAHRDHRVLQLRPAGRPTHQGQGRADPCDRRSDDEPRHRDRSGHAAGHRRHRLARSERRRPSTPTSPRRPTREVETAGTAAHLPTSRRRPCRPRATSPTSWCCSRTEPTPAASRRSMPPSRLPIGGSACTRSASGPRSRPRSVCSAAQLGAGSFDDGPGGPGFGGGNGGGRRNFLDPRRGHAEGGGRGNRRHLLRRRRRRPAARSLRQAAERHPEPARGARDQRVVRPRRSTADRRRASACRCAGTEPDPGGQPSLVPSILLPENVRTFNAHRVPPKVLLVRMLRQIANLPAAPPMAAGSPSTIT